MKADKGNCFVVLDSIDYNNRMNALLNDSNTYELVSKSPFRGIERELNNRLSTFYYIEQLIFQTQNKEKRLNLLMSPTLYDLTITPKMSSPTF